MVKGFVLTFILIAVVAFAEQVPQSAPMPLGTTLTVSQKKILDYLLANWGVDTAMTSIDLAMKSVGGKYTDEDRYVLGAYIREHPESSKFVRFFGWETVALNPEEKLIARHLSSAERGKRPAPSLEELAKLVEVSPESIREGLKMLQRFGLIRADSSAGGAGYRMASEDYVHWEGGMKITFTYHRAHIEGVKSLDTW